MDEFFLNMLVIFEIEFCNESQVEKVSHGNNGNNTLAFSIFYLLHYANIDCKFKE